MSDGRMTHAGRSVEQAAAMEGERMTTREGTAQWRHVDVMLAGVELRADVAVPRVARGLVIFAHGRAAAA